MMNEAKGQINQTKQSLRDLLDRSDEMETLIELIWLDIGPYGLGTMKQQTVCRLQDFMKFGDSE